MARSREATVQCPAGRLRQPCPAGGKDSANVMLVAGRQPRVRVQEQGPFPRRPGRRASICVDLIGAEASPSPGGEALLRFFVPASPSTTIFSVTEEIPSIPPSADRFRQPRRSRTMIDRAWVHEALNCTSSSQTGRPPDDPTPPEGQQRHPAGRSLTQCPGSLQHLGFPCKSVKRREPVEPNDKRPSWGRPDDDVLRLRA